MTQVKQMNRFGGLSPEIAWLRSREREALSRSLGANLKKKLTRKNNFFLLSPQIWWWRKPVCLGVHCLRYHLEKETQEACAMKFTIYDQATPGFFAEKRVRWAWESVSVVEMVKTSAVVSGWIRQCFTTVGLGKDLSEGIVTASRTFPSFWKMIEPFLCFQGDRLHGDLVLRWSGS